ncbi:thioredoxin family protein [Idiomarina seosinensis]|uniref:thioredoxin family protein n=1 Tax=Idiomarina seosinensis TaxID=281739 RepID=UPI00384C5600
MTLRVIVGLLICFSTAVWSAPEQFAFRGQQPTIDQLQQAQEKAKTKGKKLMLVLGANWCGDSKALVEQFSQPAMAEQLNKKYQIELADIGYFEGGYSLVEHWGEPIYYGTPTVIIVDPDSGAVLNKADWQHWTNASQHSLAEFREYFLASDFSLSDAVISAAHKQQLAEFEKRQSRRIKQGYQAAAPLLKDYKESGLAAPPEAFMKLWLELAEFRNQVHSDVVRLTAEAGKHPKKALTLPAYGMKSWE